ncbi:tail fiber domain-containing protein|uniref:tail fiber domain-containing protein n=1 Tax=Pseudomonas sp. SbOxS1 TaxID=2723884 RepID=UPI0015D10C2F|nr:tail fiber domain-containing protein [Pseudomonas sp. SbOxS1]NYU06687.1 tail fiber domain-containing protein [Pseudomonas sp. SbOxS1]
MRNALTLLTPLMVFLLTPIAHAESSAQQQICHNGVCYDIGGPPGSGGIGGDCCPFSDERLKQNVQRLENPTENLLKLRGVTFNWKQNDQADVGLIAQDVQKVYPQLVRTEGDHLQVDYQKLVAPLIESVRELNARVQTLETALANK